MDTSSVSSLQCVVHLGHIVTWVFLNWNKLHKTKSQKTKTKPKNPKTNEQKRTKNQLAQNNNYPQWTVSGLMVVTSVALSCTVVPSSPPGHLIGQSLEIFWKISIFISIRKR